MLRAFRILFGLLAASLVAGLVLVLHVVRPSELMDLPYDVLRERLFAYGYATALYATQLAMFAVPFGILLAIIAEANRWRSPFAYAIFGLLLATAGYLLQYQSEGDLRTIVNMFAGQVFLLQGLLGGLTYWLLSGRFSGWRYGGGPMRIDPIPVGRPRLQVADAVEPTAKSAGAKAPSDAKPVVRPKSDTADVKVIAEKFAPASGPAATPAKPARSEAQPTPPAVAQSAAAVAPKQASSAASSPPSPPASAPSTPAKPVADPPAQPAATAKPPTPPPTEAKPATASSGAKSASTSVPTTGPPAKQST